MYPKSGVSLCLLLSPYVMVLCSCAHAALPNSNSAITYRLEGRGVTRHEATEAVASVKKKGVALQKLC